MYSNYKYNTLEKTEEKRKDLWPEQKIMTI